MATWREMLGALLGISAYQKPPPNAGPSLDSPETEKNREAFGGQLSPLPQTQTRWYLAHLEQAIHEADAGDLSWAARLYRSFRRDGVLSGLLATRTGGLVRLPKRFNGDSEIKAALEKTDGSRSVFDDMFPSSELALIAADGICLGVGVGELVPVEGRDFPVLIRLDPEFLRYRWAENRWYYVSVVGLLPITPGDGRWVLHIPGGRMAPWQNALWQALGQSWINKSHAIMHRSNFSAHLANPARIATSPIGANDAQRQGFLAQLMGWGVNTAFELPAGYDAKILETNGRGWEVFQEEVATCDNEIIVALAGQTVTTDGGTGFANADIHKSIRADLIKETSDALAYTINTQGIPQFVVRRWGLDRLLENGAQVEWDVTPPKDVKDEADSLKSFGEALNSITAALQPYKMAIDVGVLCNRFGIPIMGDTDGDGRPDEDGVELPEMPPEEVDTSELDSPTIQ
jgi:hypothetical protein